MNKLIQINQQAQPSGSSLLDVKQVARLLGKSTKTLSAWRQRGFGPTFIRVGKSAMYYESDIHEWLQKNRRRNAVDG
ncbi:MAG: helix-turn-helix transcriptional regulator [Christensenellaceae bacterium]|jgi:predicted DNA-binding transcriptional regulator AlpA